MMTQLMTAVRALTDAELEKANEQHPMFASDHEAIAVIWEEVEEAQEEMNGMITDLKYFWDAIKKDKNPGSAADWAGRKAQLLAAEAIQIAAMCKKREMCGGKLDKWRVEEEHENADQR